MKSISISAVFDSLYTAKGSYNLRSFESCCKSRLSLPVDGIPSTADIFLVRVYNSCIGYVSVSVYFGYTILYIINSVQRGALDPICYIIINYEWT